MNIKTEVGTNGIFVTIITLKNGLEIELHGKNESLTITNGSECFDFSINPEGLNLCCDGRKLRLAVDNFC